MLPDMILRCCLLSLSAEGCDESTEIGVLDNTGQAWAFVMVNMSSVSDSSPVYPHRGEGHSLILALGFFEKCWGDICYAQ